MQMRMVTLIDTKRYDDLLGEYVGFRHDLLRKFSDLLATSTEILDRLREKDRLHPPKFNIFRVLSYEYREVGTHSAMLAFLLVLKFLSTPDVSRELNWIYPAQRRDH